MPTPLPPLPQLENIPPELLQWLRTVEVIIRELQEGS